MYAVFQTGGKQYRAGTGQTLKVEKLGVESGDTIEFDKVLMVQSDQGAKVGTPFIEGGKVSATVKANGRHKKINILKFKRRKHYMRHMGHRQYYTEVEITEIVAG